MHSKPMKTAAHLYLSLPC